MSTTIRVGVKRLILNSILSDGLYGCECIYDSPPRSQTWVYQVRNLGGLMEVM